MKKHIGWSYAPYRPPLTGNGIYICRLVPEANGFSFDWLPVGCDCYEIFCRKRGEESFLPAGKQCAASTGSEIALRFSIEGLESDAEYEFYVSGGEQTSPVRLVRTGTVPGTPVNYLHPQDGVYSFSGRALCSPCMVRHPDGFLLASMDVFQPDAPQNLTLIFRSDDNGATWRYVSELFPCFWGRMFVHRGVLYMISCSTEYGDLLIGASYDGGKTFTEPTILLRGSNGKNKTPGIHKNPQPVVEYNGKLYHTLEWGNWGKGYHAAMVASVPVDADLLNAENWSFTEPLCYDENWEGVAHGPSAGTIEGTLAVGKDGNLYTVMRYDMGRTAERYGLVLRYRVDTEHPEAPLIYDRSIPFPANASKFEIHSDRATGVYFSIATRISCAEDFRKRTLLSLMASRDMIHWHLLTDLLDAREEDPEGKQIGFQYVDFFFEGEDILYLCRTAYNHAYNFHDSNYITFHRIPRFRELLARLPERDV